MVRIPIAIAMLLTGVGGYVAISGWSPLLSYLKTVAYARYTVYDLSVIPLFLLMGQFAPRWPGDRPVPSRSGHDRPLARRSGDVGRWFLCCLWRRLRLIHRHRGDHGPGRAAGAEEIQLLGPACGGQPAAGTLGILIPPSVVLVIYAILQENISALFMAAFIPGVLAAIGYMIAIAIYADEPDAGPAQPKLTWRERPPRSGVWPVFLIFLLVLGGIYAGWFTPTEAAAIGTVGTGSSPSRSGGMRWAQFKEVLFGTAVTTGMIFMILLGADVMNAFLAVSQPGGAAEAINNAWGPSWCSPVS